MEYNIIYPCGWYSGVVPAILGSTEPTIGEIIGENTVNYLKIAK